MFTNEAVSAVCTTMAKNTTEYMSLYFVILLDDEDDLGDCDDVMQNLNSNETLLLHDFTSTEEDDDRSRTI